MAPTPAPSATRTIMRRRLAIIVSTPRPGRGTGQAGYCQGQRVNVHGYTIGTAVAVSVACAIARRFGAPGNT